MQFTHELLPPATNKAHFFTSLLGRIPNFHSSNAMAASRTLPAKRNPLLEPQHTPQRQSSIASNPTQQPHRYNHQALPRALTLHLVEILVERRKLGQTDLSVKPGQVGTSNATQPKNLGPFDYAHLRVPLPKDLKGSGVFQGSKSAPIPEAYFLMVSTVVGDTALRHELTKRVLATKQRRIRERDRHVQGCLSMGLKGRGRSRKSIPQEF